MHRYRQTYTRIVNCVHPCLCLPVCRVCTHLHVCTCLSWSTGNAVHACTHLQQGITARLKATNVAELICRTRRVPNSFWPHMHRCSDIDASCIVRTHMGVATFHEMQCITIVKLGIDFEVFSSVQTRVIWCCKSLVFRHLPILLNTAQAFTCACMKLC